MQAGLPDTNPKMNTPTSESRRIEQYSFHHVVDNTKTSALRKYQNLVVGDRRLLALIKYELLSSTVAFLPGAAGIVLRQLLYKYLVRRLGKGTIIGRSVTLRHPGKITIGEQTVIDDYCVVNALGDESSEIVLGNKVFIGRNTILKTRGGKITIRDYADIGQNCHIGTTTGEIEIGRYALIAGYCYIGGGQHNIEDRDTPIVLQGFSGKGGVVIEDDVWLGAKVIINDGVHIGKGAVIGAGSVVTKEIPAYSIAYGVPAQVRKQR